MTTTPLDAEKRRPPAAGIAPDPIHFRKVLGHYPTGVSVVTAWDREEPVGMTVGSFTSVSMDPPLVAFMPMKGSRTFERIARSGRFCVNVLTADQEPLCRHFAMRGGGRFASVGWHASALGNPILDGVLAWIDCRLTTVHEAGDHMLVLGEVYQLDVLRAAAPLMFFQGGYGRFSALSLVAGAEDDLAAQLRLVAVARPHLELLSRDFGAETHANALAGDRIIQLAWVGQDSTTASFSRVGLRLPFAPPMGMLFVAWDGPESLDRWLDRSGQPMTAASRSAYAEACALARQRGWIAIPAHEYLQAVEAAVVGIAAQGHLPVLQREISSAVDSFAQAYADIFLAGAQATVTGLSAPVFDASGRVVLVMSMQGLDRRTAAELDRCLDALLAAAGKVTASIGGRAPAPRDVEGL